MAKSYPKLKIKYVYYLKKYHFQNNYFKYSTVYDVSKSK